MILLHLKEQYLVIQPSIFLTGLWVLCLFCCLVLFQVDREQLGEGNGCKDANTGGQRQHQPDHHACEVDSRDGVQDDEHPLVIHVLDAIPEADGEDTGEDVQVEEEAEPGGRLVLRHTGNDGDVDLGVACVPKGVEPEKFKPS